MKSILFLALVLIIKYSSNSLTNSTWIFKVANGCNDTHKFEKNNRVNNYDYELQYAFHGSYSILKDTITVIEKDDSHSEDNGKVMFFRTKYLWHKDSLYPIRSSQLIKGKWTDLKIGFKKSDFFKRIRN